MSLPLYIFDATARLGFLWCSLVLQPDSGHCDVLWCYGPIRVIVMFFGATARLGFLWCSLVLQPDWGHCDVLSTKWTKWTGTEEVVFFCPLLSSPKLFDWFRWSLTVRAGQGKFLGELKFGSCRCWNQVLSIFSKTAHDTKIYMFMSIGLFISRIN
jgi:hypothetical protein